MEKNKQQAIILANIASMQVQSEPQMESTPARWYEIAPRYKRTGRVHSKITIRTNDGEKFVKRFDSPFGADVIYSEILDRIDEGEKYFTF